jgi:hypothetical protein
VHRARSATRTQTATQRQFVYSVHQDISPAAVPSRVQLAHQVVQTWMVLPALHVISAQRGAYLVPMVKAGPRRAIDVHDTIEYPQTVYPASLLVLLRASPGNGVLLIGANHKIAATAPQADLITIVAAELRAKRVVAASLQLQAQHRAQNVSRARQISIWTPPRRAARAKLGFIQLARQPCALHALQARLTWIRTLQRRVQAVDPALQPRLALCNAPPARPVPQTLTKIRLLLAKCASQARLLEVDPRRAPCVHQVRRTRINRLQLPAWPAAQELGRSKVLFHALPAQQAAQTLTLQPRRRVSSVQWDFLRHQRQSLVLLAE